MSQSYIESWIKKIESWMHQQHQRNAQKIWAAEVFSWKSSRTTLSKGIHSSNMVKINRAEGQNIENLPLLRNRWKKKTPADRL